MCFLRKLEIRNSVFRVTEVTFSGLGGGNDSHVELFDVECVGEGLVIGWISGCVACAVDSIGKFLTFFTRVVRDGNLIKSVLRTAVRSETVLMTRGLSPSLH